jgi:hypothetical protein
MTGLNQIGHFEVCRHVTFWNLITIFHCFRECWVSVAVKPQSRPLLLSQPPFHPVHILGALFLTRCCLTSAFDTVLWNPREGVLSLQLYCIDLMDSCIFLNIDTWLCLQIGLQNSSEVPIAVIVKTWLYGDKMWLAKAPWIFRSHVCFCDFVQILKDKWRYYV